MTQDATSPASPGSLRYLSLAWLNTMSTEIIANEAMREAARHHSIACTQVVSDGPEGDVTYHLVVGAGEVQFGAGAADPEDVRMEQSWDTAVAVATGVMNAQETFINGHIRLFGDQQKLIESQPVFGALNAAFRTIGENTRYE